MDCATPRNSFRYVKAVMRKVRTHVRAGVARPDAPTRHEARGAGVRERGTTAPSPSAPSRVLPLRPSYTLQIKAEHVARGKLGRAKGRREAAGVRVLRGGEEGRGSLLAFTFVPSGGKRPRRSPSSTRTECGRGHVRSWASSSRLRKIARSLTSWRA